MMSVKDALIQIKIQQMPARRFPSPWQVDLAGVSAKTQIRDRRH
jgi:hypothetical protein